MTQPQESPGAAAAEAMTSALEAKAHEMESAEEGEAPAAEQPGIHHAEREQPAREQGSPGQQGQNPEGAGGPGPPTKFA